MAKKLTYKVFWAGSSYVISIPSQVMRALQVQPGDRIAISYDGEQLVVEKCADCPNKRRFERDGRTYYAVKVRVIGESRDKATQYGFTIPFELRDVLKDRVFEHPVIEEKRADGYFKLVYKKCG